MDDKEKDHENGKCDVSLLQTTNSDSEESAPSVSDEVLYKHFFYFI